jgi:hypothetical protein
MGRSARWLGVVLGAGLAAGCVERRFVVYSDPPGAVVLRNGRPLGATPADEDFVYYGKYHFMLIHEGYETLNVDQNIPAPWYEYPPLDFIAENLVPWKIIDRREFHYQLPPRQIPNTTDLLNQAGGLRQRGKDLLPPPADTPNAGPTPAP